MNQTVRIGGEAETRLRDLQALDRRLALKERDGAMDRLVLVVADTRSNRTVIRAHPDILASRFRCRSGSASNGWRQGSIRVATRC